MAENLSDVANTSVELYDRPHQPERRTFCSDSEFSVVFHHPAYQSSRLFEISAFDGRHGGIHHNTALLLCGIVAGGVWTGWLSEDKIGTRLTIEPEAVLSKRNYYFHLPYPPDETASPSVPYKWPVVMSLEDFEFPHGRPPPGWTFDRPNAASFSFPNASVSSMSQAVKDRDECCIVTGWRDGTERAHLVARSILWFFTREELDRYIIRTNLAGAVTVDDMANAITVTQVIHTALDKGTFIFVPKCGQWVPHFLDPTYDLGPEYHNVLMKMPSAVSLAFVFVNVVVAILSRHRTFFMRGETRRVITKSRSDPRRIVDMTGSELQALFDPPKGSRDRSPRKRTRDTSAVGEPQDTIERKRHCSSWSNSQQNDTSISPLVDSRTLSGNDAYSSKEPDHTDFEDRLDFLRRQQLKEQRSLNKDNWCCDYDAAEDAIARGVEGRPEYGGGHICMTCLAPDFHRDELVDDYA